MTASSLQAALRAGADGLYALEAGTGLIIAHGSWPAREDFGRFIHVGSSITVPGTELASIDWEAAITALDGGEFPSSSGEKRMLRHAASLAGDIPVRLGDAVTGIDGRNVGLLAEAVLHASGHRQFPDSFPSITLQPGPRHPPASGEPKGLYGPHRVSILQFATQFLQFG